MGCLFPQQQQEKEKKKSFPGTSEAWNQCPRKKKISQGYWRDELIKTQTFELMSSLGGKVEQ